MTYVCGKELAHFSFWQLLVHDFFPKSEMLLKMSSGKYLAVDDASRTQMECWNVSFSVYLLSTLNKQGGGGGLIDII